ncbi:MAG: PIN domain-containing protein [Actinoallomurus sp.]
MATFESKHCCTESARDHRGRVREADVFRLWCVIDTPSEAIAKRAGELLGRTRTSDAVDAIVVATAIDRKATLILTSDPDDLKALLQAADVKLPPLIQKI